MSACTSIVSQMFSSLAISPDAFTFHGSLGSMCFFWCLHFTCLAFTVLLTFPLLMHFYAFIIYISYSTYSTCSYIDGMLHIALLLLHFSPGLSYIGIVRVSLHNCCSWIRCHGFLVSQTLFLLQEWFHTLVFWFRASCPWPCDMICCPNFCCVLCLEARCFALHCCG